ncbi:hypothetical protein AVEN_211585-1 [Araneus ventricosus]|uniref:Uncharacterized protein n=1 Tax=Araneus ventricosus TaxID=182803 RepID=A0A4Y2X8Z9_ARAVE|nr:hypothetical protein AVEN_116440-1 [Araneus ventricosus]GBO45653.1 hypothetical protein AVEN_246900-1 [Araneus ventricosus]GBO45687.1 hypothetical protein AVEN_122698-1 [Araneus ventricosus]GBO45688.1 hypothetical protein AVEN_211585-1 [Araneus ventricosus]
MWSPNVLPHPESNSLGNKLNFITCNLSSNDGHPLWDAPCAKKKSPYDAWSNRTNFRTAECYHFLSFTLPSYRKHVVLQVAKELLDSYPQDPPITFLKDL